VKAVTAHLPANCIPAHILLVCLMLTAATVAAVVAAAAGAITEGVGPSAVDKSCCDPLPSPVRRVFYLSREGTGQEHEVSPPPNPRVLTVSLSLNVSHSMFLTQCFSLNFSHSVMVCPTPTQNHASVHC
jgi:hypothetical protein